ncbi:MAG TPA: 3-phosphoshikimate 1-carboxyvinyltransferase [Actinomycetota bacterium]|nr:3-phosphoshikimate 1-carboxyvinyltransferase [Actinomycetota bacterium]
MKVRVMPGGPLRGQATVPGDKSIAHRWLILAVTGAGRSSVEGLPHSLDIRSTASCLAELAPATRPALEAWGSSPGASDERHGSTWNQEASTLDLPALDLHGEGRASLRGPVGELDCGNSGTSMRLLAGLVAPGPFVTVLTGDASLVTRPMERVAAPLRAMGADVATRDGHPPVTIRGGELHGIRFEPEVPSAQVKGAVLLAALEADGATTVAESVPTRDHTERALGALGAPVRATEAGIVLDGPFRHEGFRGKVPGDPSSAAFLLGAAALTGGEVALTGVGLNPSRLAFLEVFERMGVQVDVEVERSVLGEPVGTMHLVPGGSVRPVHVGAAEVPLVIDEVPILAALAAHADGPSRFVGAAELRVKESDRLSVLADGIRSLGGLAEEDGDDLVIEGGGLRGGSARSAGDHRIVMALTVAATAAERSSEIDGAESAAVSFPGFFGLMRSLGADVEEAR